MTITAAGIGWGFDCLGSEVQHLMNAVWPTAVWPYVTGDDGVAWSPEEIDYFRRQGAHVFLVNQGYEQGPAQALTGDEFDFEAGAWTLANLLEIVEVRRKVKWSTRIYCTWANYAIIKQALAQAGTGDSIWFRIADWNLDQHLAELELHSDVYAGQWASPSTNPATLIPGTTLTLSQVSADLSVVLNIFTGWAG
jgi:hypothetical protein